MADEPDRYRVRRCDNGRVVLEEWCFGRYGPVEYFDSIEDVGDWCASTEAIAVGQRQALERFQAEANA